MEARENHKQVAVLVELKARFDEEHNIAWSRAPRTGWSACGLRRTRTENARQNVSGGAPRGGWIIRYVHMGTGNYNPVTGRIYTDLSYFTCDPALGADVAGLV